MKKKFKILFLIVAVFEIIQCDLKQNTKVSEFEKITALEHSWDYAVPQQNIPEGLTSISSKSCGQCHQSHYEEWQYSTHSHAWTDLQFQAELKKETSPFMCINCHIPLQNQQEYIVKGLINGDIYRPVKIKNPHFDENLQQEGINCAACHVRNNAIIGPTGTKKAPHKTIKDTLHLSEQLCISCHNAVAVVTPTLACTFETGNEWKSGPFYGDKNCISCHMDRITRAIVPGYTKRISHLHYFPGSGIPKLKNAKTKMLLGLAFYPGNLPDKIIKNDSTFFIFKVKNEFAGHKVPTGDPERFITFDFIITNLNNDTVKTITKRIGEHWEWYPKAKKINDNNLLPQEERQYKINLSNLNNGTYKLNVIVKKHRASKSSVKFNKLSDKYPIEILIYDKTFNFKVMP